VQIALKPIAHQIIVITGASSGMGLATARLASARGAKVLLAARDGAALERICSEIQKNGGFADFLAVDVGSEDAVKRLAETAIARFGGFDTWVNVAGVGLIGQLKDVSTDDHRRLFDTNYWGIVHGSLAAARHFRHVGTAGAIINVGSAASDIALPLSAAYSASKFAVKAFTNVLRIELMQEKLPVSICLIKPSAVDSKFTDHAKTLLGGATAMPPPRYAPSVVAKAILHAAQHRRREIAVGAPAYFGGPFASLFPGLTEKLFSLVDPSSVVEPGRPAPETDNLHDAPVEGNERSGHNSARAFSVTTAIQSVPAVARYLTAAAVIGVVTFFWRSGSKGHLQAIWRFRS
jgi:short-subunit dehydrogenase